MRGSKLGLLAIGALVVGVAGCSLPEVLPVASGTSQGPSPYGPWYEQHWATNAVLLAAADQPEGETPAAADAADDTAAPQDDAAASQDAAAPAAEDDAGAKPAQPAALEASSSTSQHAVDFNTTSPYQFPASSYAPAPSAAPQSGDGAAAAPTPSAPEKKAAPASGGPIRY